MSLVTKPIKVHHCAFCNKYDLCSDYHYKFSSVPRNLLVQSPSHEHALMALESNSGFNTVASQSVQCNSCKKTTNDRTYYCPQCDYRECGDCALPKTALTPVTQMQLQVNLLSDFLKSNGPNHYQLTVSDMPCPSRMALIANRHWDLSQIDREPVPHFEVTFSHFEADSLVSVGIGNQIFVQNQLLGYQQNTFGYLSSGEAAQNVGANVQLYSSYGQGTLGLYQNSVFDSHRLYLGDTVGTGVLLDTFNRHRLFFTKNGQMIAMYSEPIHTGMDCFPGVSFTKTSGVEFDMNMSGPFKFDVSAIPDYRKEKIDRFHLLPPEVWANCLTYASISPIQTLQLRLVSINHYMLSY
jgi:hypothetical protein